MASACCVSGSSFCWADRWPHRNSVRCSSGPWTDRTTIALCPDRRSCPAGPVLAIAVLRILRLVLFPCALDFSPEVARHLRFVCLARRIALPLLGLVPLAALARAYPCPVALTVGVVAAGLRILRPPCPAPTMWIVRCGSFRNDWAAVPCYPRRWPNTSRGRRPSTSDRRAGRINSPSNGFAKAFSGLGQSSSTGRSQFLAPFRIGLERHVPQAVVGIKACTRIRSWPSSATVTSS